jgi:hypothetical protein
MKTKLLSCLALAVGLGALAALDSGCMSTRSVTTAQPVKQADGSIVTNEVTTTTTKGQDPLKDKVDRYTAQTWGLSLRVLPPAAGTSGNLSPVDVLFGKRKETWDSYPVYPGVEFGYTPPFAVGASTSGSLWNDSDTENIASAPGLNPTNAYYQSGTPSSTVVNPLQVTSGTVTAPTIVFVTNAPPATVTAPTNAPAK